MVIMNAAAVGAQPLDCNRRCKTIGLKAFAGVDKFRRDSKYQCKENTNSQLQLPITYIARHKRPTVTGSFASLCETVDANLYVRICVCITVCITTGFGFLPHTIDKPQQCHPQRNCRRNGLLPLPCHQLSLSCGINLQLLLAH